MEMNDMSVAEENQGKLGQLKKMVEASWEAFHKNQDRYQEFMRFVFACQLSNEDITKLQTLQKPTLEFNVLEAVVSGLRGEFAQQDPEIHVRADDGVRIDKLTPTFLQMLKMLEGHFREIMSSSSNDGLSYDIYTQTLGGGYSVVEIFTEYLNELSFDQCIKVKKVFDPTLTGFDPMARESHKGDGKYCFQIYPRIKEDFEKEFGKEAADGLRFSKEVGKFTWSYNNQRNDIILVVDLFEKQSKKIKIVKLSTGHVVNKKHYKELLDEWNERGFIEQPPIIIEERETEIESIVRWRFCESKVLRFDETDYKYLPLIFIDGNSVEVRDTDSGSAYQMTRPYVYHAKGIQRLKNASGQTVGSEIENMVQHKFKVAIEAIPEDYQEAYRNVQQADVLMYNAFYNGDATTPLPPPMEIQRTPTPPLVESTFLGSDRVTQAILGSYDIGLNQNQQDISGKAIANGALRASAASIPYLESYIKGLNRIATVVLDLIPKYYVTPRTLPIKTIEGKRSYQIVNDPSSEKSIDINYKSHELQVKVEAGVNTAMQKQMALEMIVKMMQASPLFAEFINTNGLEIILDNIDIRGIEGIKAASVQFMEQKKQQAESQAKQPPIEAQMIQATTEIEMAKIEQRAEQAEGDLAVQAAKLAIEKQKVDAQVMEIMNEIETKNARILLDQEKVDSENARSAIETAIELTRHHTEKHEHKGEE